jgi:hypothetical protein
VNSGIPRREQHVLKEITGNEVRGRKPVLSEQQINEIEDQIEYGGIKIRALGWLALAIRPSWSPSQKFQNFVHRLAGKAPLSEGLTFKL